MSSSFRDYYRIICGGIHKNLHFPYYVKGFSMLCVPRSFTIRQRESLLRQFDSLSVAAQENILHRVDYYCHMSSVQQLPGDASAIGDFTFQTKHCPSVYFFDSYEWLRFFPEHLKWQFAPGDITCTFDNPTIAKSRPIDIPLTDNSVLINMDKVRHFLFFKDPIAYEKKKSQVFFRGAVHGKPQRAQFFEHYFGHPLFDLKDTSSNSVYTENMRQRKETTIYHHLGYKYIMSLQGNDVASNLKWVMNSNSIAVSPKFTIESWFMEGQLKPNEHYIEIRPDFSDIEERIAYYNDHAAEAKDIIENAHAHCRQFQDPRIERLVSLMVMDKYFRMTGQMY